MDYIHAHPFILIAAYYVASSAVQAMPEPDATSSWRYVWFHNFTQLLMSNWSKMRTRDDAQPKAKGAAA